MASSVRLARSANGTPMTSNSSSSQPTPTPRIMRPFDRTSRVATSFATTAGARCGRIRMPVARRTLVLWAATNDSHTSGSGMGDSSVPGIFPFAE